MHVMHLIESLEFGGAEKVLIHLANRMSKDMKVSVCLTKRQGELLNELNSDITIHFLDGGEGNNFSVYKSVRKLVNTENVSVLHSHDWGVYLEATFATLGRSTCKHIHTVHGHYTNYDESFKSKFKRQIRHFLELIASNFTHKIVPVSHAILDYIVKDMRISEGKVMVIHNGIIPLKVKKRNDKQIVKLVSVGRLAEVKNYPMMLRAISILLRTNNDFKLSLIGDGIEMSRLKNQAKELGIETYVEFLGFRRDISSILPEFDIFLCTSSYEGISLAILEAMSAKIPVVSTRVGGVPETVIENETGILVELENDEGFSKAIESLIVSKNLRDSYGEAAKNHFDKNFHEDVVIEAYRNLYTKD